MFDPLLEKAIFDSLLKTLKEEDSPVRRVKAVSSLGILPFEKAFTILSLGLQDNEVEVREKSAFYIGEIASIAASEKALSDGVMLLSKAVQDSNHTVREEAISSLGKIDSEESFKILLKVLKDRESEIIIKAASSLGEMYTKDFNVFSTKANIRNIVVELHQILESQVIMANSVIRVLESISDSYSIPNLAKYQDKIEVTCKIAIAAINNIKLCSKHNDNQPIIDAIKDLDKKMPDPNTPKVQMTFTNSTIHSATGNVEGDLYVNAPTKTLAESAKEIQDLLAQLNLNTPATNEAEQVTLFNRILQAIKKLPNLRDMFLAGGIELVKIICPPLGIPIEMSKKLLEAAEKEKQV